MINIFKSWCLWASKTFPTQTVLGKVNHLEKEVAELKDSILKGRVDVEEIADILGLLFSICDIENIPYDSVIRVLNDKLEINKARDWQLNTDGSYSHIKNI